MVHLFYYGRTFVRGGNLVGALVIAIAVVLCSAYLLWQIWEADLVDDR